MDDLLAKLETEFDDPADDVANAMAVYRDISALITRAEAIKAKAKSIVEQAIILTGQDKWETDFGRCYITKPGVSVRWDSKSLDALIASDDDLYRKLSPFRAETERPGTLTIRSK